MLFLLGESRVGTQLPVKPDAQKSLATDSVGTVEPCMRTEEEACMAITCNGLLLILNM